MFRKLVFKVLAVLGAISVIAQPLPAQNPSVDRNYENFPIEGFSQPFRSAKVAAAVAGIVEERTVVEGTEVSADECVLRIDSTIHSELLKMSEAAKDAQGELATAEAELNARRTRFDRIEELASRDHATPVELLQARELVELAEASLLSIQEKQLQRNAEHKKLTVEATQYCVSAPFDGVVVEFLKEKGEYVGPADPTVCVIAQLDVLSVNFLIPRLRQNDVVLGAKATILFVENGRRVTGTIYYVSPFPSGETNMINVKVRVDNANRSLNAGSRCHLLKVDANYFGSATQQLTTHHN